MEVYKDKLKAKLTTHSVQFACQGKV